MLYNLKFLQDRRTFGGAEGSKGGSTDSGGSKSTADSTSFKGTPKPTIGAVGPTGQYAGDGFEWVSQGRNENGSLMLTRTYTGANKDVGLGQDVISGGTSDKNIKTAIGQISLDEGSSYASIPSSATDGDALQYLKTAFNPETPASSGRSASFAEQMGRTNYAPAGTTPANVPASAPTRLMSSLRPQARPRLDYTGDRSAEENRMRQNQFSVPAATSPEPVVDYGGESSSDYLIGIIR